MDIKPASSPLPVVMTFAASDPTGGGGMQADILTLAALGTHPLSVLTGFTLQDTAGIEDVQASDGDWVVDQARVLLEDMRVQAFKVGVLVSIENVAAVAEVVSDYPDIPLVFDPVITTGRGDPLVDEEMLAAMSELLLPLTTVLTPNTMELRRLAQEEDDGEEEAGGAETSLADCARHLIELGAQHVLVTGAHEQTPQVVNTLHGARGTIRTDAWERLPGSYHGAGDTLAAAIAAFLAHGMPVPEAVQAAQRYTWDTLAHGLRLGMGQMIPDRFYSIRQK
ncbi:bifunctional hydroxymethylpyrimidine kinase/phosphomethylpyrimidine kinase [Uliginosibacterium sp. H1]|uniref:bifunctional hydroxymethylpyrimidine kinase/phosphomethylpyrimidine kinase n=1 Tax=Uliginosibacterium sp. H1 TaxID=3114757 RepID=UPI002E197F38|nr:hydroxymethylpyrimidine/phosphomethylpyrimidine kinase [Uliginosibacterium sp. H1]